MTAPHDARGGRRPEWLNEIQQVVWPGNETTAETERLAGELAELDPLIEKPRPEVIAAAVGFLRCRDGDPQLQLAWAGYVERAAGRAWGEVNAETRRVLSVCADVFARQGMTFEVVRVYGDRVEALRRHGRLKHLPLARRQLALALHRDQQCDLAEAEISDLLDTAPAGGLGIAHRSTVVAGAMIFAGCGRPGAAAGLLHEHAPLVTTGDHTVLQATAYRLTDAVLEHRPLCRRLPPATAAVGRLTLLEFWTRTLSSLGPHVSLCSETAAMTHPAHPWPEHDVQPPAQPSRGGSDG